MFSYAINKGLTYHIKTRDLEECQLNKSKIYISSFQGLKKENSTFKYVPLKKFCGNVSDSACKLFPTSFFFENFLVYATVSIDYDVYEGKLMKISIFDHF